MGLPWGPVVKTSPSRDFPGGAVVKNPPANAGDTGSIPGLGRSHMQSLCATTTEPALWSPCSPTREATAMRSPCTATKCSLCSPQLEKARAQQRRPNAAKNKIHTYIHTYIHTKKKKRLRLPMQRVWVRPLVGELRSHVSRGQKTKT